MKQATENKRQFDEEVEIHSDVADFSNGGVYAHHDGDFGGDVGDVFVDVDENILFQPNHFQSVIVKILGSWLNKILGS